MSATTTWKCPQDGMEWSIKERKCPTCGYVNMPKCVTLRSDATAKTAEIATTTRLGKSVFTQRFADPDAKFAADEQYEIVRDDTQSSGRSAGGVPAGEARCARNCPRRSSGSPGLAPVIGPP